MSARDLCSRCAAERNNDQKDQLVAGQGEHFESYRRGVVEYAHRLISS